MVGFGPEDDHFVVELTYNYGIKEYKLGNDFQVGQRISFIPKGTRAFIELTLLCSTTH